MAIVELRNQRVSDAKRFFKILNNPNFKYFDVCPKDVEAEREFLRLNASKRKNNQEYNFSILLDGKLIGGCGIRIHNLRKYIGEIGFFIDEAFWGQGITVKAVKLLEKIGLEKHHLKRFEIIMLPQNTASEKVAIKCGYFKEGTMRKSIMHGEVLYDAFLYAKVV